MQREYIAFSAKSAICTTFGFGGAKKEVENLSLVAAAAAHEFISAARIWPLTILGFLLNYLVSTTAKTLKILGPVVCPPLTFCILDEAGAFYEEKL